MGNDCCKSKKGDSKKSDVNPTATLNIPKFDAPQAQGKPAYKYKPRANNNLLDFNSAADQEAVENFETFLKENIKPPHQKLNGSGKVIWEVYLDIHRLAHRFTRPLFYKRERALT